MFFINSVPCKAALRLKYMSIVIQTSLFSLAFGLKQQPKHLYVESLLVISCSCCMLLWILVWSLYNFNTNCRYWDFCFMATIQQLPRENSGENRLCRLLLNYTCYTPLHSTILHHAMNEWFPHFLIKWERLFSIHRSANEKNVDSRCLFWVVMPKWLIVPREGKKDK